MHMTSVLWDRSILLRQCICVRAMVGCRISVENKYPQKICRVARALGLCLGMKKTYMATQIIKMGAYNCLER
jgi:hypothetical protein